MAVGDVKADFQTIAASGVLTIQPPVGEEWVIHNLYWTGSVSLKYQKGSIGAPFDTDTGTGARLGLTIHVTNSCYLTITNTTTGASNIGYDGIQTK